MFLKTVARYIRRSPYQAVSAVLIMMLTFFIVSVFSILTIMSVRLIAYFESKPQLTVFFKENTKKSEIESLKAEIEKTGHASSIVYVSREEALKIYREQNKNDPLLLDLVTSDILPESLEVSAQKAENLSDLARIVKKSPITEEVIFQQEVVDTLVSWITAFRKIGIVVISILSLESIFVVLTIIGFKILARREEIEIMRLIGASDWFIRTPFLMEGALYGLLGAVFGWMISYTLLLYSAPLLESFLKGVPIFPIPPLVMFQILGLEAVVASIIGMFASFLAVLRYLK